MTNKRPVAVFQFSKYRRAALFIAMLRNLILNIVTNSGIFVTPAPTVMVVTGHVDELDDAQAAAQTRASGKVAIRNAKRQVVKQDVFDWLAYVQKLADGAPDEETAIVIIE